MKRLLMILVAMVLASCAMEQGNKPVLPQSAESDLPWNTMQPGEGQGMFGAMRNR